jgi:hypothetical protein
MCFVALLGVLAKLDALNEEPEGAERLPENVRYLKNKTWGGCWGCWLIIVSYRYVRY